MEKEEIIRLIKRWEFMLECGIEDEVVFKDKLSAFVSASDVYIEMKEFLTNINKRGEQQ